MVDFQRRDTRRDLRDAGDEKETDSETATAEEASDSADAEEASDSADAEETSNDADAEDGSPEIGGDELHDTEEHEELDPNALGAAVVSVSSERSLSDDPAGDAAAEGMEAAGHEIVTREMVQDAYDNVQQAVNRLADRDDVDVVITIGGTGITPDDVTIEAVTPLFDKELPGFGELFRLLSYDEVGSKIVATRATGGVVTTVPVFCLPGSERAARLGTERIIVEEAGHLAGLACQGDPDKHPR